MKRDPIFWLVGIMALGFLFLSMMPAKAASLDRISPTMPASAPETSVRGPLDALGRFVQSQEAIVGVSVSPLDVRNLQTEGLTLLRGPAYGQKGLSLVPGRHKKEAKPYMELDYGGAFNKDEVKFRLMLGLHPANLTNLILEKVIKTDRLRIPPMPENMVAGPMFRLPLPGDPEKWTWRNGLRLVLAYRFE